MRQRTALKFMVPASALVLTLSHLAAAQTDPRAAAPTAAGASPPSAAASDRTDRADRQGTDRQGADRQGGDDAPRPAQPIGAVMQRNGGSLFRAQLSSQAPDPLIFGNSATGQAPAGPGDPAAPASENTASSVSFFAVREPEPKKIKKHDLITIVVHEESAFSSNGTTDLKKTQDFDAKLDAFVQLELTHMRLKGIVPGGAGGVPEVKTEAERDFTGTGEVDRKDSFTARIQAEVVDVKPNGNLVLQAVKRIKTDEEEQRLVLTGICKAEDIAADNSILSSQLYDLELEKMHKGAVTDTTHRGFIPRLLDQVNPF